jgi:hypothetical protein
LNIGSRIGDVCAASVKEVAHVCGQDRFRTDLAPAQRHCSRQLEAPPEADDLGHFFEAALPRLAPRSELAKAIGYARSRWAALTRYLDDGRLEISNSATERAIRPHRRSPRQSDRRPLALAHRHRCHPKARLASVKLAIPRPPVDAYTTSAPSTSSTTTACIS